MVAKNWLKTGGGVRVGRAISSLDTEESIAISVFSILAIVMLHAGIYGYKATHWTKADRAMVEGRFDAAIEFIEHSKQKDDAFKLKLYNKVYKFATQEAGISDPDDPILLKLYEHGVERRDPILFRSKGKWSKTFPRSKKKLTIKRNKTRKS